MVSVPARPARSQVVMRIGPMIRISGLPDDLKLKIAQDLRVTNPEHQRKLRFSGFRDPNIPKWITGYLLDGADILVAPGVGKYVWSLCLEAGLNPVADFGDLRPLPHERISYDTTGMDEATLQLQTAFLAEIGDRRQAFAVAPCGGGKTDAGIRWAIQRGQPTLIVVYSTPVMQEWVGRIALRTGMSAVTFGGNTRKKREITADDYWCVATAQSLAKYPDFVQRMAVHRLSVIVDEAHHMACPMFIKFIRLLNPIYRLGLTATPKRQDGLMPVMQWWIGPIVARMHRADLEDVGRLARPRVEVVTTDFECEYNPDVPGDYDRLMKLLHGNDARHELVLREVCTRWRREGGFHLVLCGYVPYADRLALDLQRELGREGARVTALHAKMRPASLKREIINALKAKEIDICVATTLADEGLDAPHLTHGYGVTPCASESKIEQRVGRISRAHPGKPQPVWVDFTDPYVWCERTSPEGELYVTRVFINQLKKRYHGVYKRIADCDHDHVRSILRGRWSR